MPPHYDLHISTRHRAHFAALSISPTTDFTVVRAAFKAKALSLHPDKSKDPATVAAFRDAREALAELQFLQEFPALTLNAREMTEVEKEVDEARERLAKEEEERTKDRLGKKESVQGSYAFVVGKGAVGVEERTEKRAAGMAFVMKKKRGGAGAGAGGGNEQHESKAESAEPKEAENQELSGIKKKQFSTTKDRLNEARAHANADAGAATSNADGRHAYDDFFEMFDDANWDLGAHDGREDGDEDVKVEKRRGLSSFERHW